MTLRPKILLRVYLLTLLIIVVMSVTYYYLFTRDVRERSHQNVRRTFDVVFDDLSARVEAVRSKIDLFVQTSLSRPKINSDDKTADLYLKRAAQFMVQGVPDDWDGIETLDHK